MTDVAREPSSQSAADFAQFSAVEEVFDRAAGSMADRLDAFAKFASRQSIAKFLARYEIYKKVLGVHGSVVECGVMHGGGLFTWAKLSAILEPANHTRRIIGFDTFEGFPSVHDKDRTGHESSHSRVSGLTGSPLEDVQRAVDLFDLNRSISHIQKVHLVKGDIATTAGEYLAANPHTVVALLNLDADLYEPTKAALEAFVPRMPKGAIVVFDELNAPVFPGETRAVHEYFGLNNIRIERFPFDSYVSYSIL